MPTRLNKSQESALAKTLGAGMRTARQRAGLRQEDVARMVGTWTEVYGRMERGHKLPSVPMLVALGLALNAKPNELLGASPVPEKITRFVLRALMQELPNTPDVRKVLRCMGHMQPIHLRTIAQLAAQLSKK
jgi:transcriptional regulator with XRE-family HTH domain